MNHDQDLREMLRKYLSGPQMALFDRIGNHDWFLPERELAFRQALEPLAHAVRLGLKQQVQHYFSYVESNYSYDLFLKTAYVVWSQLNGDGSALTGSNIKLVRIDELDTLLPSPAFSAIERLCDEGFASDDFGIANRVGDNQLTLVLRIGDRWLRVMSWKIRTKGRNW